MLPDFDNIRRPLDAPLPLFKVLPPLADDNNKIELEGSKNNNPPRHVVPLVDNQVDDSAALVTLPPTVKSVDGKDEDDVTSSARGLLATG